MRLIIEARIVDGENGASQTGNTILAVIERPDQSLSELGLTLSEGRALLADVQGEQLKLEAALGNTLAGIARNLLCSGSSRFRHFSHFQFAVQHG